LNPNFADAHCGRGNVFTALNRYDDALAAYDKALSLKPHLAEAWLGRGTVLTDLNRYNDVFAAYDKAFSLQPDLSSAEGSRLFAKMYCCIWSDLDAECEHLLQSIRLENKVQTLSFFFRQTPRLQTNCNVQIFGYEQTILLRLIGIQVLDRKKLTRSGLPTCQRIFTGTRRLV
jgi:tetratricopeptide (TPR) repeat protein